jgi:hypothetical protein
LFDTPEVLHRSRSRSIRLADLAALPVLAKVANEILWRDNMSDLILDATRFPAVTSKTPTHFDVASNPSPASTASADGITTDQAQLSCSFDVVDARVSRFVTES